MIMDLTLLERKLYQLISSLRKKITGVMSVRIPVTIKITISITYNLSSIF